MSGGDSTLRSARAVHSSASLPTFSLVLVLSATAGGLGTGNVIGPLLAVLATALVLSRTRSRVVLDNSARRVLLPASVLAGAASPYLLGTTYWAVALVLSGGAVIVALASHRSEWAWVALPLFVATAAVVLLAVMPAATLDVWFLHREAGIAVRAGGNPWTDLRVPNGAPGADAGFITGYPYPPIPLFTYALIGDLVGDPRVVTVLAWLATAGAIGLVARSHPHVLSPGWILVANPAWAVMLWAGWTEPLSIALATVSWAIWRRSLSARTWVLGALLASKQYFLPVGVLLARMRELSGRTRIAILSLAGAFTAIAAIWGWTDAYDALVGFHTRQPARADGLTLYGLGTAFGLDISPPSLLAPVAALLAAFVLPRDDPNTLYLSAAATLSVFFLLGTQSFANYWFLVFALVLLAIQAPEPTGSDTRLEADIA